MASDAAPSPSELQALREEIASLKSQVSEPDLKAFEQIKELRSTQRRLSDDVKRLTGEGVQLAFKNRQFDQQVKKLQAELEAALSRGVDLDAQLADTQKQLAATQKQLQESEDKLDRAERRGLDLDQSVESLQSKLGEATQRGQQLDVSIEELRGELGQSREVVVSHEAELVRQKDQLGERQARLAELQEELGQRENRISKLEQLVNEFKEQFLSGDFDAVAASQPAATGVYGAIMHQVDLALGLAGRTLVDQVYDLLELDRSRDQPDRVEELFDTLADTGSQLFSEPSEQTALKQALAAAWQSTGSGPAPSPSVAAPVVETPPAPAARRPLAPPPLDEFELELEAAPPAREHEAPSDAFPLDTSAEVVPTGAADAAPVDFEAEPETAQPEPEAELELDLSDLDGEVPPQLDSERAGAPEESAASGLESILDLDDVDTEPPAPAAPSESEPPVAIDWVPPRSAAKQAQIAEALAQVSAAPAQAKAGLEAALASELEVPGEGEAFLALARCKQNEADIVPDLAAAMAAVEVPDLFALLSTAQATAEDEIAERLDLFEQFSSTPRGEMTRSEGSLGLGKRPLNRDFVASIGNEQEQEIVEFLRDQLIESSGLQLPVPSADFEERLASTGPSAFVGTLRQALRAVDYSLFDFPDLKVRTYDGDDLFVVDGASEPEKTLVFHRDIEGMPPEELTFLALRQVIRMYRGHSQLAHQSQALTPESRAQLVRQAVDLYLRENSAPHPSLTSRLDALDPQSPSFAAEAAALLRHWYEASEWEPFLWTGEFLFDDEVFRRRLDPVADHAAARLTGVTAATYGLLRDELLETPDVLEALNEGLADLFAHMPENGAARLRLQRLWSEFLQEEEA